MTDILKPATRINEFTLDIFEYCESEPYLRKELDEEFDNFCSKTPEKFYKTEDDRQFVEQRFGDYFIFSYISKHYKKTPLAVFLSKMLARYSHNDQRILNAFIGHIFSGFSIGNVFPGYYFIATDLSSKKEYKVRENRATYRLKEGDYIVARIVPYEEDYGLSVVHLYYPERHSYELKRMWNTLPPEAMTQINPLMIERTIFQRNLNEEKENKNFKTIENKLKKLLKKYLGKKAPSIKNLKRRIIKTNNPFAMINELSSQIIFSSDKEMNTFLQVFMDFCNYCPRDDLNGRTPEEIETYEKGPWEKRLTHDLMHYIHIKVNPSEFNNQNELRKEIQKHQKEWLHQPQEELDNKSPWTVILEERKSMNNPRKDFSIKIDITPIDGVRKGSVSLSKITPKDVPLANDLESFIKYFEENRVKVTQKNRWIPFKHLKLIEKEFVHPEKDIFHFIGKEETRGQEITKRYIYLIDLLCRGKRLIQINKQGYIEINTNNYQTFKKLIYGEKVFQLLMTWIEKIKWEKLQFRDFAKPYAREYQQHFNNILYLFSQYKTNEKIDKELFLEQLYGTKLVKEKFSAEIIGHLLIMIEFILLRHLEWFGVIATKKGELVPGIPIESISTFWVTQRGSRLIKRVIYDLIDKGKIKISQQD
jgi:hypothetical protein